MVCVPVSDWFSPISITVLRSEMTDGGLTGGWFFRYRDHGTGGYVFMLDLAKAYFLAYSKAVAAAEMSAAGADIEWESLISFQTAHLESGEPIDDALLSIPQMVWDHGESELPFWAVLDRDAAILLTGAVEYPPAEGDSSAFAWLDDWGTMGNLVRFGFIWTTEELFADVEETIPNYDHNLDATFFFTSPRYRYVTGDPDNTLAGGLVAGRRFRPTLMQFPRL